MGETDRRSPGEIRRPEPPLPEESELTLEEYLAMQRAIGHPMRFQILRALVANDELSATDLKRVVDADAPNFHYHLSELADVGLVEKRQRRTAAVRGFTRTTGRPGWDAGSSNTASRS